MIAALLLAADAPTLGAIGRQALPEHGCAAYLWSASDRRLVAMASAEPAELRLSVDGRIIDLARVAMRGEGAFGLPASADYQGGAVAATLDLTVATGGGLRDGAAVPQALMRVKVADRDELAVPLGGMIGCAPADPPR